MERFQFRRHLYLISNHLSSSEVENLKFLCTDLLPRRKVEKVTTAFELFCLLEDTGSVSMTETAFLEELLQSLRKKHLIQPLLEQGGGRGVVDTRSPHIAEAAQVIYDMSKLKSRYKKLLVTISDDLQESNVRDIGLFFFDPSIAALSLKEIERMRSGSKLFQVLQDNGTITPTDMQRIRTVLETIGRRDLCTEIDDYMKATKDFIVPQRWGSHDGGSVHYGVQPTDAIGGGVQPTDCDEHPSNISMIQGTQLTDYSSRDISLSSEASSASSYPNDTAFLLQTRLMSGNHDGAGLSPSQPQMGTPITMSTDSVDKPSPFVHGTHLRYPIGSGAEATSTGRRQDTAQLLLVVDKQEKVIQEKEEKIHALQKTIAVKQQEESRYNEVVGLRDQLGKLINEHESLRQETERLREQVLRAEDVPLYEMSCKPHGVAVIIVNEFFTANPLRPDLILERREGAEKDFQLFRQTFHHLKYRVTPYKDLSSVQMYEVLDNVAKDNHKEYDSFVCCISTHGDVNVMYGTDSVGVKRTEFDIPLKKCETLAGKPKMFFIQACRLSPLQQVKRDCPTGLTFRAPQIPLDRDVFKANATTAKNASYRSPRDGSWFVKALHGVFTTQADFRTLVPMMYEVNNLVTGSRGTLVSRNGDQEGEEVIQCAEWTTTFTKGVRFRAALTAQQFQ